MTSTYLDGLVCSNTSKEISIPRPILSICTIYILIEVEWSRVSVQNVLEHDGIALTNHEFKLTGIWRDIWTYFPVWWRWLFNVGSKPEVATFLMGSYSLSSWYEHRNLPFYWHLSAYFLGTTSQKDEKIFRNFIYNFICMCIHIVPFWTNAAGKYQSNGWFLLF